MNLLLSQLAEKNDERTRTMGALTRELISAAVAKELNLTVDAVRALCVDTVFEDQYRQLATDLLENPEFGEALEGA